MHIDALERCNLCYSRLQGAQCRAASVTIRSATQTYGPLQRGRLYASCVQKNRARTGSVGKSYQGVAASSSERSSKGSVADQTLPVTPEVIFVALPVLIVAIPWALGHLQLCVALGAVIALSPFGTVIWSLVPLSRGRPFQQQQQQQRWRRRSQMSWRSTDRAQPFWSVKSQLLQERSLVAEADVLGPSSDTPQSRGNASFKAQVMPQGHHSFQQRSARLARDSISMSPEVPQRQAQRKHRRVGSERVMGQPGVHDDANSAVAMVSQTIRAGISMQQAAQDFVAPPQPTAAGFWEEEPLGRRRKRPLLSRMLRSVPFVGSWGGLL